jgi:hypothetical protein
MYKTIISIIVAVIVIMAVLLGGFFLWQKIAGVNIEETSIVVVEGIKKIAELATIEYLISTYEHKREKPHLWWPKDYIAFVKGKVIGSVDLDKSQIDINTETRHVDISFQKGAIKIHSPEIAPGDIYFVICKDFLNKVTPENWTEAVKMAEEKMLMIAMEEGIKAKTANEAKVLLGGFLASLGYTSEIVFNDSI